MARPRDPSALQKLKGVNKKNPKRMRREPEPTGPLGVPPEYLSPEEKARWFALEAIVPPRVLTNADRVIVEVICRIWAQMIKDGVGGRYGINNGQVAALLQSLGQLGLTPAARSKVTPLPEKPKENEFSDFAPAPQGEKPSRPN